MTRLTLPAVAIAVFLGACATTTPEMSPASLRVLAYNIKHGYGMDGEIDLERVADLIRAQDADVVTLQEIDEKCGRSGGVDQAKRLGELCGMDHRFGEFMDYDGGRYGMAILSRLPIVESTNHVLPPGAEPRSALDVRVRMPDGREVIVTGIHFYASQDERLAQAEALAAKYEGNDLPIILAGDYNSTRGSVVMDFLEASWTNPIKDGDPNTFPSDEPEREIDFILVRSASDFTVRRLEVIPESVVSDHRPVVMDVELH